MHLKNITIINTKKKILKTYYLSKQVHIAGSFSILYLFTIR